jgi:hypothetical protein
VAVTMSLSDQTPAMGQDGRVTPRANRPKRRTFTASYKMRILQEYDALPEGSSERGAGRIASHSSLPDTVAADIIAAGVEALPPDVRGSQWAAWYRAQVGGRPLAGSSGPRRAQRGAALMPACTTR